MVIGGGDGAVSEKFGEGSVVGDGGVGDGEWLGWAGRLVAVGDDEETFSLGLALVDKGVGLDGEELETALAEEKRLATELDEGLVEGEEVVVPVGVIVPWHAVT